MNTTATFETLNFDNLTLRSLPIDQTKENYVRKVKDACFSRVIGGCCCHCNGIFHTKDTEN